jgi:hypothetical protein
MTRRTLYCIAATAALLVVVGAAWAEGTFEGRKKCYNCHKSQGESWDKTLHAKAMESLKAKLDPKKDYTTDKDCVGCHVDGWHKEGGYHIEDPDKFLTGVGCESCHGAGSDYRKLHRKAGEAFEKSQTTMERAKLVEAGQEFEFAETCHACHLNYEGSPWKGVKKPYTPFTPKVDKKYAFDFEKAVRSDKALHKHFKLDGVFTGPPIPKFHEGFQKQAKPPVKSSAGAED